MPCTPFRLPRRKIPSAVWSTSKVTKNQETGSVGVGKHRHHPPPPKYPKAIRNMKQSEKTDQNGTSFHFNECFIFQPFLCSERLNPCLGAY
eukprot:3807951-Amphidinium_carterae.1